VGIAQHWAVAPQLVALVACIAAWQLQEFCRRVLYTETRMRGAFCNDVISYGGQTLLVAILWWRSSLTGPLALWVLAGTSAAGAIVGAWQIRDAFCWRLSKQAMIDTWHFGKWLLGSELLQWLSSLQMFLYLAAIMIGVGASGTLRAAQLLFGPTRSVGYFLQMVLPIRFTRALNEEGESALAGHLRRACVLVVIGLGPYCLLLALFPQFILTKLFADASYADHPAVLRIYSIQAMMSYFATVMTAALAARRMTRDVFLSCVCGSIVAVALSWPFIHWMGVVGAVACMLTSTTIMSIFLVLRYRARTRQPAAPGSSDGGKAFPVVLNTKEEACAT
jgi:O-antigen/teichoic acid export membrane protein